MSNKCGIQENSLQSHSIQLHHETKFIVSKDLGLLREQTEIPKHWCSFGELQQKIQIAWGETVCIHCTYNIPYTTLYLCIICYQTPEKKKPYMHITASLSTNINFESNPLYEPSLYITLVATKARTSFGRLSFQFSAANDWNTLQKSLKLESTVPLITFKSLLANLLSDHCTC